MSNQDDLNNQAQINPIAPDFQLTRLVDMVNHLGGVEIPVTLSTSGQIITGRLVSGEAFFSGIQSAVRSGTPEGAVDFSVIWDFPADFYRQMNDKERSSDEVEDREFDNIGFFHLLSAEDASGHQLGSGFWRGRLDCVDGWTLGG